MDRFPVGKYRGSLPSEVPFHYLSWFTEQADKVTGKRRLPEVFIQALRAELAERIDKVRSVGAGPPPFKAENLRMFWKNFAWIIKQAQWVDAELRLRRDASGGITRENLPDLLKASNDLAAFSAALLIAINASQDATKRAAQLRKEADQLERRPALLAKLTKEVFDEEMTPETFAAEQDRAAAQRDEVTKELAELQAARGRGAAEGGDAKLHLDAPETLDVLSAPPPAASQPATPGGEPSAVGDAWEKVDVAGSPKWELDLSKPPPELDWKRPAAGAAESNGQSSLPAGGSSSPAAKSAGTSRKRKRAAPKRANLYTPRGRVACTACGGSGGTDETCAACGGSGWEAKEESNGKAD